MVSKRLVRLKHPRWIRGDDWGGDEDCGNKIERPFWPFCVHFCMCARVHVGLYVRSSATGCAGVASCTQIYCTIRLPLFATMENLRMN